MLYTNAAAMPTFVQATDLFIVCISAKTTSSGNSKSATSKSRASASRKSTRAKKDSGPKVTCYLCVTPGHYCNNTKFHKRNSENKYPAVSESMQKKILERVDEAADLPSGEKAMLKGTIRQFWKERCEAGAS